MRAFDFLEILNVLKEDMGMGCLLDVDDLKYPILCRELCNQTI